LSPSTLQSLSSRYLNFLKQSQLVSRQTPHSSHHVAFFHPHLFRLVPGQFIALTQMFRQKKQHSHHFPLAPLRFHQQHNSQRPLLRIRRLLPLRRPLSLYLFHCRGFRLLCRRLHRPDIQGQDRMPATLRFQIEQGCRVQ